MVPNIHILGIQGSGKGTQSALLVQKYGLTYASSGNLFRERAQKDDFIGKQIAEELTTGKLLSDNLLFTTIDSFLEQHPIMVGFLGDGVIRSTSQYQGLLPVWDKHLLKDPFLIVLDLSEDKALSRIKKRQEEQSDHSKTEHYRKYGGKIVKRTDDNPLAIEERFRLYHTITKPVIALFEEKGDCAHIEADICIEAIHQEICTILQSRYPSLHGHR